MNLSITTFEVKRYGKNKLSRTGFVDDRGQTFLTPKSKKKLNAWFQRFEIDEATQALFRKTAV